MKIWELIWMWMNHFLAGADRVWKVFGEEFKKKKRGNLTFIILKKLTKDLKFPENPIIHLRLRNSYWMLIFKKEKNHNTFAYTDVIQKVVSFFFYTLCSFLN